MCTRLRRATVEATAHHGLARVDVDLIASAAAVSLSQVRGHGPGTAAGWVADSYATAAAAMQDGFENAFSRGRNWREGLHEAVSVSYDAMALDPDLARFCFVEIAGGPPLLRALRERVRARTVTIVTRQYAHHYPRDVIPRVHLELTCAAIIAAIGAHAADGRTAELPAAVEAVVSLGEACSVVNI